MIPLVNEIAEFSFRYMASAGFQATLLALLVLGVLRLGRRWPPALRHAILMLALLKFVIPPMLSFPTGIFNRISQQEWSKSAPALRHVTPVLQKAVLPLPTLMPRAKTEMTDSLKANAQQAPDAQKQVLSSKGTLFLLHLSGALLILVAALLQQLYLRRLAFRAGPVQDPALSGTYDALCQSLKPLARPRLLISEDRHAPITFGAWKPVIILPQAIVAALTLQEIRTILGHELAHHRRQDPWLAWLQVIISAVWWFNPVYWLLSRQIRSVREDCCDDMVVSSGIASRESYCRTLLQAARVACSNPMTGAALAYVGESQPLRRRFKRIMTAEFIRAPQLAVKGMIAVFTLALLLLPGIKPRALAQDSTLAEPYASNTKHVLPHTTSFFQEANQNSEARNADQKNKAEENAAQILSSASQQPQVYEKRPVTEYYLQQSQGPISQYYFKWLTEDVFYIITPEERRVFLALGTDRERESFIEQFWARRGSSFKEEHYRRIAYANEHFGSSVPGWRTDRGRIYIMFGKPDELESHPTGGAYKRPFKEGGGRTTTYPFEKWWYRHIDGVGDDIEIEFIDQSGSGEYMMAMSPDEKDALINVPGAGLDLAEVKDFVDKVDSAYFNPAAPSGSFGYHLKIDHVAQSAERDLWSFTIRIDNKDLEFVKLQNSNRAIVSVYGKISNTNGRVYNEWEDLVTTGFIDQLLEEGKTRQSEWQRIIALPPGLKFKLDIVVEDRNSKKTGIAIGDPPDVFERMEQYFDTQRGPETR